jgi:hypothetical protein
MYWLALAALRWGSSEAGERGGSWKPGENHGTGLAHNGIYYAYRTALLPRA